MSRQQQ